MPYNIENCEDFFPIYPIVQAACVGYEVVYKELHNYTNVCCGLTPSSLWGLGCCKHSGFAFLSSDLLLTLWSGVLRWFHLHLITFTIVKNQSLASANIWSSIVRLSMFPLTFANCAFPMSRTYLGICLVCFSARMCPLLSSVCICAVSRIPSSLCSLRQSDFLASFSLSRPCPGKKEFDQSGTAWLLFSSPLKTISMCKEADMG